MMTQMKSRVKKTTLPDIKQKIAFGLDISVVLKFNLRNISTYSSG